MENSIGVGIIVGLTIGTSLFVYNSDRFNKIQKTFLLICIVFPPLQWISILVILGYNSYKKETSFTVREAKSINKKSSGYEEKIESLKDLKQRGIVTEEEYNIKTEKLKNLKFDSQLKLSEDYKKLKSLYNEGILTNEEFERKLDIIRVNAKSSPVKKETKTVKEKDKFEVAKTSTILYRLSILIGIATYPFILLIIAENIEYRNYSPNWMILYWIISVVLLLKFLRSKKLFPAILGTTIIFTILTFTL